MLHGRDLVLFVRRYRNSGIYFFIIAMLALTSFVFVERQRIYDQLNDWKLIPRPERLTELYFTDHKSLPKNYSPGQHQDVAFTLHNIEYRTTTYHYEILQTNAVSKATKKLAAGTAELKQDSSASKTIPVLLIDQGHRSQIIVNVTYDGIAFGQGSPSKQSESIHYWITNEGE